MYSASFAAVPHVVAAIESAPARASFAYFTFPAWVEVCRRQNSVEIPTDLAAGYFDYLARLPALVAAASAREWDEGFLRGALAAIAAAKGHPALANAVLELAPDVLNDFERWLSKR